MKRMTETLFALGLLVLGISLWLFKPTTHIPTPSQPPQTAWAQTIHTKGTPAHERLPEGNFGQLFIKEPNGTHRALEHRRLSVRVKVRGRIARTEVEQLFFNTTSRQTEGTFTFRLPHGAAITRLAMEVNGTLIEGELVERTRARAIYGSIVRSMKDPALLEWQGGNRFRTQIFPIPANGTKRIILGYDHILDGPLGHVDYTYILPSKNNGPKIGLFEFSLQATGTPQIKVNPYDARVKPSQKTVEVKYAARNFRARGNLVTRLTYKRTRGILYAGVAQKKSYGLLELPIQLKGHHKTFKNRLLLLDRSAGMKTLGLQKAIEASIHLLHTLPKQGTFGVLAGDLITSTFRTKAARLLAKTHPNKSPQMFDASHTNAAIEFLKAQRPRGATHLEQLLLAGIRAAAPHTDLIYLGDGMASIGQMDPDRLVALAKKAIGTRHIRISSIAIGPNPDMGFLHKLARATGGRAIQLLAGQQPLILVERLHQLLQLPQLTDIKISTQGMTHTLRAHQGNLASGETLILAGQLTAPAVRITIKGKINRNTPFSLSQVYEPHTDRSKPIVPAFWARFNIEKLQKKTTRQIRQQIVKLSKDYGVMSRYTSYLVLENDRAYKKYKIARKKQNAKDKPQTLNVFKTISKNKGTLSKEEAKRAIQGWMGRSRPRADDGSSAADSPSRNAPAAESIQALPRRRSRLEYRRARRYKRTRRRSRRYAPAPKMACAPSQDPPPPARSLQPIVATKTRTTRTYSLKLRSLPSRAKVYKRHNNRYTFIGFTPLRISFKPGQPLSLKIVKRCYLPYTTTRTFNKNSTLKIRLRKDPNNSDHCRRGASLYNTSKQKACNSPKKRRWKQTWNKQQRQRKMFDTLRKSIKKNPLQWNAHQRLFEALLQHGLKNEALVAIQQWRLYAPEEHQLIIKEANLLKDLNMLQESRRVLSEMIEFSPQDYGNRIQYATQLKKQGNVSKACQEYAQAVRLNPAQRNTFRTMMSLARQHKGKEFREIIRACIQRGVSQLPVERDISIVMFWDDPSADIDLHIHEPDGAHVYYSRRESPQGGTLYYDITNGLGPEIYVLGSAKKGRYRIGVVYFSGNARRIKGKIIIMRNAGSPKEQRSIHTFTLHSQNTNLEKTITTLQLK